MTDDDVLATSPLLFGYRGRNGRLAMCDARLNVRFRPAGTRAAEVATAFLQPRSVASARGDGFTVDELQEAREAGILVSGEELETLGLWERSGWSRAAYLLFGQMDIPYRESDGPTGDRAAMTAQRRAAVEEYQADSGYPRPAPLVDGPAVELPRPQPAPPTLASLTRRRSARAFSPRPPDAAQLAGVLHAATAGHRMVEDDRADGDPFRLLNSLYSWAHPFVVVQEVDGLPAGVFEYDWASHRLLGAGPPPSDDALLGAVQGQRWILGRGFAIFLVADLRGYAWLYRHSRAYLHVLAQVGELGQEVLMAATDLGLAGWTTPAVHESRAAKLLGLPEDESIDPLCMIKLGRPLRAR